MTISCVEGSPDRIAYILYPMEILQDWVQVAAKRYRMTIACITGMDWDNDLSPWSAPGQPPGSPDFHGLAPEFLFRLTEKVVPETEKSLGLENPQRILVGVSMSGLFALWQRFLSPLFPTIATLSGSFWYPGFVDWVERQGVPVPAGKVYMSLGNKESNTPVRAFRTVAGDTQRILLRLRALGVDAVFESVPGNHYADPIPRLDKAFSWLASNY